MALPLSFNDPQFSGNTLVSSTTVPNNGSLSNRTITDTRATASIVLLGSATVDNVNVNSREGVRIGGSGTISISNSYLESTGIPGDHADTIQAFAPGGVGNVTITNTSVVAHPQEATAGMFVADNYSGNFTFNNVVFNGGPYGLRLAADGPGNINVSMTNVYFVGPFSFAPFLFQDVGAVVNVTHWENVRNATIVGGVLVPGSIIDSPSPVSPFPDANNTGPTPGTIFTPTAVDVNSTSDGQVIQNLNLTGQMNIHHNNVTIQDCIINSTGFYGITTFGEIRTGLKILRCRIFGADTNNACIAPDGQSNVEIAFCDLSGKENGILIGGNNYNIHDNYIHDLGGQPPDPHIDGIQGAGGFSGLIINHNTVISLDTSCIILQTEGGSFSNVTISNNLFKGDPSLPPPQLAHGILCQALDSTPSNTCSNITITNNRFQVPSMTFPCFLHKVTGLTFTGNVNDSDNAPISFTDGGGNASTTLKKSGRNAPDGSKYITFTDGVGNLTPITVTGTSNPKQFGNRSRARDGSLFITATTGTGNLS